MKEGDKKIKVCQVASVDISLKFLLFEQMKYLKKHGFEVWGVASRGKWISEIEAAGIPVKTIEIKRKIFSPFADFVALIRLVRFFRREKFDIIHTHTPKASLLGQVAAIIADVPIRVNTIHGFYFQDNSPRLKRFLFIIIEKIIAQCVDLTFTVNREDIKTAVKENIASPESVTYLGDGVDLNHFDPARFSSDFIRDKKEKLSINPNKKIIGIVARLVKEKGYFDLFAAFENVLKKFPDTVLLVVGPVEPEKIDGINPDIVKEYGIEKNVIFLGELDDVVELYPLMDVFVLPSYREGLGLSILEASAMEVPVIATDIRGCREAVDDGVTGILIPPKNPEKLASAITHLFTNPDEARQIGNSGREKVKREFEANLVFNRIKVEYQRLIKEKLS